MYWHKTISPQVRPLYTGVKLPRAIRLKVSDLVKILKNLSPPLRGVRNLSPKLPLIPPVTIFERHVRNDLHNKTSFMEVIRTQLSTGPEPVRRRAQAQEKTHSKFVQVVDFKGFNPIERTSTAVLKHRYCNKDG